MKELIDRISNPKPWMIVVFCSVTIFALLAFPLQSMRTSAQTDKELRSQVQKGDRAETGSSVDVLSIDPSSVPPNLSRLGNSADRALAPAVAGQLFSTNLSGGQEVPPNASTAFGTAIAILSEDQNSVDIKVTFSGLTGGNATASHIHGPAAAGVNGPVMINFPSFPAATSGTYNTVLSITPTQIAAMQAGQTYVNIHNAGFPGGEIRGQLALSQPGDIEPNDTAATASPIPSSARVRGNIAPNGDVDVYSFFGTAGSKVYAAVQTSGSASSSTDSQLRLLGTDGTTVIEFDEDDGSLGSLSSTIAGATLPTGGTFYLQVKHFSATNQLRPYDLYFRLQSGAPTPEVEANDTPATANPLPASGWVSGTRNPAAATEQDWYSFTANAGDTVYLGLDVDPERDNVQWDGRLGIALFGDANNQILVVNDASAGSVANPLSEAMFMTVKTAGTYFAFVDSASAAVGGPTSTYNLSVTVIPKVNEGTNCTTYTSTNVPQTIGTEPGLVSSTITVPGSPRIADLDVNIQLNHTRMADIDAHLRSPSGNDTGLFTDIGAAAAGGQAQMDITFDDEAAVPPTFTVLKGLTIQPELAYRLNWFDGENAGGTWTLDLRDDTAAEGGTLTGWSMTICEEPPPPACPVGYSRQTIFTTDFESGAAGFTHSGLTDEWELGLPATVATSTANPIAAFNSCNSGVNCWKTDLDNTYNAAATGTTAAQDLLSPPINLAGVSAPIIVTWAQKNQVESATFDHMSVDAQQVGGATPVRLFEWLDGSMIDSVGNPTVNVPTSAGWGLYSKRIDSLAGTNAEVRFRLESDDSVNFAGMAIDDVTVTGCRAASADLSITKTDGVSTAVPGGNVTYTITASNAGPDAVTGATVTDTFPAAITSATWTCVGAGGGTCTAAGAGNINDSVNLPVGGSVTYTVMANIGAGASGTLVNTATVSSTTPDPNAANNSATDTDTLVPTTVKFNGTPNIAIPDNAYNGTLGSMACNTIDTTSLPNPSVVGGVQVAVGMSHTFVGDLTIKLITPTGSVLGLVSRPGVIETADDGNDTAGFGENSNLLVANPLTYRDPAVNAAEMMGKIPSDLATDDVICVFAGSPCEYKPAPGSIVSPKTTFASLNGENARGNWQLCIGDSATLDTGTFANWSLSITPIATASGVTVGGNVLTPEGRGVRGARVTITDNNGVARYALTGSFGRFQFDDVEPGQTYIVSIGSRRFTFSPQVVQVNDNVADLSFVAGQ